MKGYKLSFLLSSFGCTAGSTSFSEVAVLLSRPCLLLDSYSLDGCAALTDTLSVAHL